MKEENLTFWKRIVISIKDIEKYRVISEDKMYKACIYLFTLVVILTTVISVAIYTKFDGSLLDSEKYITKYILESNNLDIIEASSILQGFVEQKGFGGFAIIYTDILFFYIFKTILDTISLSIIGYFICKITRFKMDIKGIFNISAHCLTLPILLNIVYILSNIYLEFKIEYFSIVYSIIACIYLIAGILLIRDEINKRNIELMRILEEQEKIKQELKMKELKRKEQEEKEAVKKKDQKKEKEEKSKRKRKVDEEPEGNNA